MRLNGRSSESRNRRSDPQFSEQISNSAPTAIRSFLILSTLESWSRYRLEEEKYA